MKESLTILGSGVGIPDLEHGKEIRYPPAYLLETDRLKMLIECSPGTEFRLAQAGVDFSEINLITISHFHPDHFGGLVNFVFFARVKAHLEGKLPLKMNIIGPKTLKQRFSTISNTFWEKGVQPFSGAQIDFTELSGNGEAIDLEEVELKGFAVFHEISDTPALALRLEFPNRFIFAYSGDSGVCDGLFNAAEHADLFLCEASANIGEDKSTYGHMNPFQVGELCRKAFVKRVLLTHYWYKDKKEEIIREVQRSGFKGGVEVVVDFQKMNLA